MFKLPNETHWRDWAPLPLRLVIGYGFMVHGWAKLSRGAGLLALILGGAGALSIDRLLSPGGRDARRACWRMNLISKNG